MIEYLHGRLLQASPTGAIVDVNGVGYGVELPLSAMCMLPAVGGEVSFWIYTHVREDSLRLFAFLTPLDRSLFAILLSVSGVGPKTALGILSTLKFETIQQAIIRERVSTFEMVPGIGKRLAEKILVDLKPKLKKLQALQSQQPGGAAERAGAFRLGEDDFDVSNDVIDDVRSALENFGFKEKEVVSAVTKLQEAEQPLAFPEAMRLALSELGVGRAES